MESSPIKFLTINPQVKYIARTNPPRFETGEEETSRREPWERGCIHIKHCKYRKQYRTTMLNNCLKYNEGTPSASVRGK